MSDQLEIEGEGEAISAKPPTRWGDLRNRLLTAFAVAAIAGLCIFNGGLVWTGFVCAVGALLFKEWVRLVSHRTGWDLYIWLALGAIYVGFSVFFLIYMRERPKGISTLYSIILGVIMTDCGAYFLGRFIGGKKIAPLISPSKTWAGLIGGAFASAFTFIFLFSYVKVASDFVGTLQWVGQLNVLEMNLAATLIGAFLAIVAQCGDFFESWMKRQAGVKDSGSLLPGHGGIFDRVDGLLSVTLVAGSFELFTSTFG